MSSANRNANASASWGWVVITTVLVLALAGLGTLYLLQNHAGNAPGNSGAPEAQAPDAAEAQDAQPPTMVRVGRVQEQVLQARWDVIGRLQELQRAVVPAEVAGRIMRLDVIEGDRLEAGQMLAEIEGVWARLRLAAADANVLSAQTSVDQSYRDLRYLEDLAAVGSAKPKEVEDTRSQHKADQARLSAAVAERDRAAEEVNRLQIRAPFDGVVVRKMTEVGQWVTQGSAVVELLATGQIDAVIDVPEDLVNHVAVGEPVEVLISPLGKELVGQVVAIVPSGSNVARTFPVKIRLDDHDGQLKPGMSVVARVPTSREAPVLTVPRDAVLRSSQGATVWAAVGEPQQAMALPIRVEVLFGHGDRYAVRPMPTTGPPLAEGMPVVIEGAERLFPSQPVAFEAPGHAESRLSGRQN